MEKTPLGSPKQETRLLDNHQLLESVKRALEYHQTLGIRGYQRTKETEAFLTREPSQTSSPATPASPQKISPRASANTAREAQKRSQNTSSGKRDISMLTEINDDIRICSACELHQKRVFPVTSEANHQVRLLVVGDWCRIDMQDRHTEQHHFGSRESAMLIKMMEAIQLGKEQVMVTNLIKCAIPDDMQPKAESVRACFSYMHRQIAALKPEAVLAMGMVTAKTLLESSLPLSRLRGRMHSYKADDGNVYPLMPTYHPNYLLQNSEMKKATWADLQILAKHLGLLK